MQSRITPQGAIKATLLSQTAKRFALSGSVAQTHTFDGMGRRTRLTTSGLNYRHQGYSQSGKLVYEAVANPKFFNCPRFVSYAYLDAHLVARGEGNAGGAATPTYLHTDGLGTPVAETDPAGNLISNSRSLHEPYGLRAGGPATQGLGYTGHVYDTTTTLSYMQQRYYDPIAGRFLSVDPVSANPANGGNFNRYWYANNNPYGFVDPDGRYACTGSHIDCGNFEKALDGVEKASENSSLSGTEKKVLGAIISAFGKKGDDSVRVGFGNGRGEGSVGVQTDPTTGKSFQAVNINGKGDLSGTVTREGQHLADNLGRGREVQTLTERRETERNAYRSQGIWNKAIDYVGRLWSPIGGINENTVNDAAEMSITKSCTGYENAASCQ